MISDNVHQRDRWVAWLGYALLIVLVARFATLGAYPLTDTTEARYAEIARVMLATGDWVTPQLEPGSPFWGKPPLYAWLTTSSFATFGVNEFAARLPQFLLLLGVLGLMTAMASGGRSPSDTRLAQLIVASSFMVFVASGAVMTDMALLLGLTMAMVGFWRYQRSDGLIWQAVFFLGLAIGLLAKGPIALILAGLPLLLWLSVYGRWQALMGLHYVAGLALVVAIAGPWYLAAELKTPGFLNYFLLGEHVLRFIQPGWSGDLYGTAHDRTRGTIWLYWIVAALPWSPVLATLLWKRWRARQLTDFFLKSNDSDWHGYLFCWMISPMLFFTFAGNILPAYVLPGIPPLAWLLTSLLNPTLTASAERGRFMIVAAALLAPMALFALITAYANGHLPIRTEKTTIATVERLTSDPATPLLYFGDRPMSAAFYSRGGAERLTDWSELPMAFDDIWIVARKNEVVPITNCQNVAAGHRYRLKRCTRSGRLTTFRRRETGP